MSILAGADRERATRVVLPARARGERGSTLVEMLAATAIMGTAVVAVLACMIALFTSTGQNRQSTTAAVVTRDYAEALELAVAQTGAWCASSYTVSYTPPAGYSVAPAYGFCPVNNASTPQLQTVTITATSPNGATETLNMVVRKP